MPKTNQSNSVLSCLPALMVWNISYPAADDIAPYKGDFLHMCCSKLFNGC